MEKEGEKKRLSWDEYFLKIAKLISERSTCPKRRADAILVKDKRILSTGHNGSLRGLSHCDEEGCLIRYVYDEKGNKHDKCMRTVHAELNAILQCACYGISANGSTLYCTFEPCDACTKAIINTGIKRIVVANTYEDEYGEASRAELTRKWLKEASIPCEKIILPKD
jgi:dCMP deaminase